MKQEHEWDHECGCDLCEAYARGRAAGIVGERDRQQRAYAPLPAAGPTVSEAERAAAYSAFIACDGNVEISIEHALLAAAKARGAERNGR